MSCLERILLGAYVVAIYHARMACGWECVYGGEKRHGQLGIGFLEKGMEGWLHKRRVWPVIYTHTHFLRQQVALCIINNLYIGFPLLVLHHINVTRPPTSVPPLPSLIFPSRDCVKSS